MVLYYIEMAMLYQIVCQAELFDQVESRDLSKSVLLNESWKFECYKHLAIPRFPQGKLTVAKPSGIAGSLCSEA